MRALIQSGWRRAGGGSGRALGHSKIAPPPPAIRGGRPCPPRHPVSGPPTRYAHLVPPARDPYELLDVDRTADTRAVKRAYRRLANRYPPDAARDDGRAFVALRTAYETLIDPDRRMEWDRRPPSSGAGRGPAARSEHNAG